MSPMLVLMIRDVMICSKDICYYQIYIHSSRQRETLTALVLLTGCFGVMLPHINFMAMYLFSKGGTGGQYPNVVNYFSKA